MTIGTLTLLTFAGTMLALKLGIMALAAVLLAKALTPSGAPRQRVVETSEPRPKPGISP